MSNNIPKSAPVVKKVEISSGVPNTLPTRYEPPKNHTNIVPDNVLHPANQHNAINIVDSDSRNQQFNNIQHLERHEGEIPLQKRVLTGQYCNSPPTPTSPQHPADMLKFVRKSDADAARLAAEQMCFKDASLHLQWQQRRLSTEMRTLQETNQRLADDNQELRDLCCFLDDDRQKSRKLAREWQRFGRYTADVMRQEVSVYQNNLRELDSKQQELIKDNLELKELCLYLDEERSSVCRSCNTSLRRDDGDGSSSSTNPDETAAQIENHTTHHNNYRISNTPQITNSTQGLNNQQTLQYIKHLENKIKFLEEENKGLHKKLGLPPTTNWDSDNNNMSRPESVRRALQVLELREQLERNISGSDGDSSDMDHGEKALLREMCNVVWRKLEDLPNHRR